MTLRQPHRGSHGDGLVYTWDKRGTCHATTDISLQRLGVNVNVYTETLDTVVKARICGLIILDPTGQCPLRHVTSNLSRVPPWAAMSGVL